MQEALEKTVPGNSYRFTQPIELRVQELIAGVRSDVGINVYGDDLTELARVGDEIAFLAQVPGSADVQAQQIGGLPYLRIQVRFPTNFGGALLDANVCQLRERSDGPPAPPDDGDLRRPRLPWPSPRAPEPKCKGRLRR